MKQHIITRALAAACALACAVSLAGCGASEEGKIRIGIKFDQPGLGFKKSGTYVGFDVDVATYIAEELGYTRDEIVWKEAPSAQREAMLQNGDVDMIIATYSITDSRKAVVDFRTSWPVRTCSCATTRPRSTAPRTSTASACAR